MAATHIVQTRLLHFAPQFCFAACLLGWQVAGWQVAGWQVAGWQVAGWQGGCLGRGVAVFVYLFCSGFNGLKATAVLACSSSRQSTHAQPHSHSKVGVVKTKAHCHHDKSRQTRGWGWVPRVPALKQRLLLQTGSHLARPCPSVGL